MADVDLVSDDGCDRFPAASDVEVVIPAFELRDSVSVEASVSVVGHDGSQRPFCFGQSDNGYQMKGPCSETEQSEQGF
jgi:hypothetical protein